MAVFRIHHLTTFHHGTFASTSWQMLRLKPREEPGQEVLAFDLELTPAQQSVSLRTDFFGNAVHRFTTPSAADSVRIASTSRVLRSTRAMPTPLAAVAVRDVGAAAEKAVSSGEYQLEQYRQESPAAPLLSAAKHFAAGVDTALPALEWLEKLGLQFGEQYTFDSSSTEVSTPLSRVIELRRGVCQDFSHLFISCLRQHGIPAGYVSGYLATTPPPGQPRLQGADAMHAWVMAWFPEYGWIDYDPTNRCFVRDEHVVVARGRDYTDVSPIRGVFRGGSRHLLTLGVTVEREETA
jgi:transglutaminase-like putative cysteine protease